VQERVDVSVVLPVYNESGHIDAEVTRISEALDASSYSWEIVIVDDGSTDDTPKKLAALAEGPIRLITVPQNRGSGHARRIGTRASRGDVVVWTDADMTYPNDEIPFLVDSLGDYDQVVGARTSEQGTHKAFRVPAKWFIRKLACYLSRTPIPDLNSGFRAFKRQSALPYLHLLPNGFSCVTTLTLAILTNGLTIRYQPIEYKARAGESKFHWRRDTARYLLQVVRMIMSFNPLRVFMPIGLTMLLVAMGKGVYDLFVHDLRITANAILLSFTALQLLAIGLLADLVVRVNAPRATDDH
jgi:glycosyltransferase involved in cell wall biosynthesis